MCETFEKESHQQHKLYSRENVKTSVLFSHSCIWILMLFFDSVCECGCRGLVMCVSGWGICVYGGVCVCGGGGGVGMCKDRPDRTVIVDWA